LFFPLVQGAFANRSIANAYRKGPKKIFSGPHPLAGSKRPWDRSAASAAANEEKPMRRTVIRYRTKPEMADTNAELVAAVFAELKAAQPQDLRYMSLRLEDDTFIHVVETADAQGGHRRWQLSHAGRDLNLLAGGRISVVPEMSEAFDLERLLVAMRPRLHRYCARMVGSVIDGEDVLQDALAKAIEAHSTAGNIGNPEGWLFRIAHNTALDFLRGRNRQEA